MLFAAHTVHSLFCCNKLFCSFHKLGWKQLGIYQNWSLCFWMPCCAQNKLKCKSYNVVWPTPSRKFPQSMHWPHSLITASARNKLISMLIKPSSPVFWSVNERWNISAAFSKRQITINSWALCQKKKENQIFLSVSIAMCRLEISFRQLCNLKIGNFWNQQFPIATCRRELNIDSAVVFVSI